MTAKALRRVEQLARIVTTYEDALQKDEVKRLDAGRWVNLSSVVRELRLAIVALDIARNEAGLPTVESL